MSIPKGINVFFGGFIICVGIWPDITIDCKKIGISWYPRRFTDVYGAIYTRPVLRCWNRMLWDRRNSHWTWMSTLYFNKSLCYIRSSKYNFQHSSFLISRGAVAKVDKYSTGATAPLLC